VKSLEKEAAFYSDVLKGIQQSPPAEQWATLTERYQHLQQQVQQQQEQAVQASDLEQTLSASLQPCQVCCAVLFFHFCSRLMKCRHFSSSVPPLCLSIHMCLACCMPGIIILVAILGQAELQSSSCCTLACRGGHLTIHV
jgi:hypothetical protein